MMVRSPDKGVDLAQVSKATGEIVARIHLGKDKDPNYQVDAIANRIYYSPTSRTIVGYAF